MTNRKQNRTVDSKTAITHPLFAEEPDRRAKYPEKHAATKRRFYWALAIIFIAEGILAYTLPTNVFEIAPWLEKVVDLFNSFAPQVRNFDSVARFPALVSVCFVVALLSVPVFVAYYYWWLNSSYGNYALVIVTPLTRVKPQSFQEMFTMREEGYQPSGKAYRSSAKTFAMSIFILVVTSTYAWTFLNFAGASTTVQASLKGVYSAIIDGNRTALWISWSGILIKGLFSGLLALIICMLRDYAIWIYQITLNTGTKKGN